MRQGFFRYVSVVVLAFLAPIAAKAEAVSFDTGWKHQKFSLFSRNSYGYEGRNLSIGSDGSVSLIYKPLPETAWGSQSAAWARPRNGLPRTCRRRQGSRYKYRIPQGAVARAGGCRKGAEIRAHPRGGRVKMFSRGRPSAGRCPMACPQRRTRGCRGNRWRPLYPIGVVLGFRSP